MRRLTIILALAWVAASCGGSTAGTTSGAGPNPDSSAPTTSTTGDGGTSGAPSEGATTTSTSSDDPFGDLLGDLPQPCTVIDAAEMSALLANDLTTDDTFATDCFYEPVGGYESGPAAHTSLLAIPVGDCTMLLQTEPILPNETVVATPDYGENASLITTSADSEYQICLDGVSISVSVTAPESVSPDERRELAKTIVGLIIDRL